MCESPTGFRYSEAIAPLTDLAAYLIERAELAVVKVGSALITGDNGFSMPGLASDLIARPWHCVLVSSGAVAVGREQVPNLDSTRIAERHALSAIGQAGLIQRWQTAFSAHGKVAAQVLLTPDVTDDRSRYLNARAAMRALFDHGVVPIVNENDAVTTRDFRYGDNDRLAAQTAGLVDADLLVILSDIDGLYTANPTTDPSAEHISYVPYGEAGQYLGAAEDTGTTVGTGGMRSKLAAARIAIEWGVTTIIASGRTENPLQDLLDGKGRCTVFAAGDKESARRRWLTGVKERSGAVEIDEGAVSAVRRGASLLSVGVTGIVGYFERGDVIEVRRNDEIIGFGLAACDSTAAQDDRSQIVLRRDDLVLTAGGDNDQN
jgi:glutamate 5-kinase